MKASVLRWLGACVLLLVSACGGGSGGGGGGSPSPILSFSPNRLDATTSVGISTTVMVTATLNRSELTGPLFIGLYDAQSLFDNQNFTITPLSDTVATVSFIANPATRSASVYTGTLAVYLCKDRYCDAQYAGSPISLPYTITVTDRQPAVALSPANISTSTAAGVAAQAVLSGTVSVNAGATPQFSVRDSAGRFNPSVSAALVSGSNYQFTITLGAVNAPDTYSGKLYLSVCSVACNGSNDIMDSPVEIPYTVVVTAPATPALTWSPASISLTTGAGVPVTTVLSGTVGPQAGTTPGFAVQDSAGRFSPTMVAAQVSGANYQFTITMGGVNAPGTYSGTLRVSVCASACTGFNDIVGSPVQIPYTVVVTPPTVLQPALTSSGLPEWETHQGNAAHTGFVPTTLTPGVFSARWSRDFGVPVNPPSFAGGKVFISTPVYFAPANMYALSEVDGSQVWSRNFGTVPALNPPATYGGRVFVATSGHSDTFMWAFNANDGSQVFKVPFSAQWEHYLAPTVLDGDVCFDGGSYGGMYCLYASTGTPRWFASLSQYDQWTPALDPNYAYAYTGPVSYGAPGKFSVINRTNGAVVLTMDDPGHVWQTYSMYVSPVIATSTSVLVVNGLGWNGTPKANHVIRYDLSSIYAPAESWRVSGTYLNDPVVAAGKFYLSNQTGNQLEARDEQTGTLLWSWQPPSGETVSSANLVLVNNLVFVGTSAGTYAVDLSTHQTVWSVARPGKLAISSNRVLYIVNTDSGKVNAYNLL